MKTIKTDEAPTPIGAYSQAVVADKIVFCSGQVPIDSQTGQLVAGEFKEQVQQVLSNLAAVLAAAGCSLKQVVKTTVFMTDLSKFDIVNEVYEQAFHAPFPARAAVQVSALPAGAEVEIEAIAVKE